MENNIFKKDDLIDLLHKKTGFYKCNMKVVADALEDIIVECLQAATLESSSELRLAPGVIIRGTRKPEGEAKDPRTGEIIISPEKVVPSAVFKQSIRKKLYEQPKKKRSKKG